MVVSNSTIFVKGNQIFVTNWGSQMFGIYKSKTYPLQVLTVFAFMPSWKAGGIPIVGINLWNESHSKQDAVAFYLISPDKLKEEINNSLNKDN
jgi:hypothetical protein